MNILSIDPGETSGFCIAKKVNELEYNKKDREIFERIGEKERYYGFETIFYKFNIDILVYEEFKLYPWKAKQKSWSTFPTVEVIGVLKYLAEKHDIKIIGQGADAKDFFDNKKLKWIGLYDGFSAHERDAIRHALYYIEFGGGDN